MSSAKISVKRKYKKVFAVSEVSSLSMFLVLCGAMANAQESQEKASRQLEEVTVTARRRSESLQDVPTMVTALSNEDLQKYGISSVEDLEITTPGLLYADAVGYAMPYIRGVGSNSFSPAVDPTVGTFLDGFYSPSTVGALQYIGDVESIQVLKGPQGTLFGRNTTAGAIVIHTKKPSETLEGSIQFGMGTRNKESLSAYLSGPLFSDYVGFSVSAYTDSVDTHYTSTFPNRQFEFAPEEREGIRVKLRFDPIDWLSLDLSYTESDSQGSKGIVVQLEKTGLVNATSLAARSPDRPRHTAQNVDGFTSMESESLTGKLTFVSDSIEAWALAGYTDVVGGTLGDLDGSENDLLKYSYNKANDEYFSDIDSLEMQISSTNDWSLFGLSYNWLLGAYTGDASAGWDPLVFEIGADVAASILPPLPLSGGVKESVAGIVDTDAEALFANFSIELTEWMALDLGVRRSEETRKIAKNKAQLTTSVDLGLVDLGFITEQVPVVVRDISGPELVFEDTSYLVGVNFFPSDIGMFYAKFVQGFKSGTWNVTALLTAPDAVDPEEVDSYEVGFKGEFFDRSLRLNTAAFRYDYRGLQNYQVEIASSGTVLVKSIDEAEINGAEFDLTYMPPIDGLQIILNGSYINTEITEWPDAPCYDEVTYLSSGGCDFSGNELGGAPKYSASLDINYQFSLFNDEFQLGANYYENGGFFFDVQNLVEQEKYGIFGVRASWIRDEWGTTVSISGKNITSEDYRDFGIVFEAGEVVRYAPAAEWNASLKWEF